MIYNSTESSAYGGFFMSLDVYLYDNIEKQVSCVCECCGHEHFDLVKTLLYEAKITHNLIEMAEAAGIYQQLWRPEELEIKTAGELIETLKQAQAKLWADHKYFKTFEPENGWGSYDGFLKFVSEYLAACEEFPFAEIKVSR